jgi:hypothetical protein
MAVNLVSLVMQFLTPNMIGRIASALGLDRDTVQAAVSSAVPSLLAGFSNVAAQPGGAQKLVDAATQQTGTLDSFARVLVPGTIPRLLKADRSCFRRCWAAEPRMGLPKRLASSRGWAKPRPHHCSECWRRCPRLHRTASRGKGPRPGQDYRPSRWPEGQYCCGHARADGKPACGYGAARFSVRASGIAEAAGGRRANRQSH